MTTTVGSRKSRQSLERSAGADAPADPEQFYAVEPGEDGPEYFPPTLDGLVTAIARAAWLSVARPPQRVTVTRAGLDGVVLKRYRGGHEIREQR